MNSSEKVKDLCEYFISCGFRYEPETGLFYSKKNKVWKNHQICVIDDKEVKRSIQKQVFAWYVQTGQPITKIIRYKDNDKRNYKWDNMFITDTPLRLGNAGRKKHKDPDELSYLTKVRYGLIKPEKKIKEPKLPKIKPPKRINGKYIQGIDLYYNIIISQGKGYLTPDADIMFANIVNELSRKFVYRNEEDRRDCKQEAFLHLYKNWKHFDHQKYDETKAFPYFTEIAKRGMVMVFNKLRWKFSDMEIPTIFSLDKYNDKK